MNAINIPDAEKTFIDEQVESGRYESVDDVIHAAFELLRKQEQKRAELQALIQVGLDDIQNGRFHEFGEEDDLTDFIIERSKARQA